MLQLPNAMPYIFAGLEIAMIFALIGAIVAEFVGSERGLGMLMQSMNFTMDVAGQFSILFILSMLGLILNGIVTLVRRRVLFWDTSRDSRRATKQCNQGRCICDATLDRLRRPLVSACRCSRARQPRRSRHVRVGWCAKTMSSAAAPFAIATKMGWFEKDGIKVDLVPLPGSTDCVKLVATKELQASLPSVEPLAIIRPQGVKAKILLHRLSGQHLRHRRAGRQPGQDRSPTSRARRSASPRWPRPA